MATEQSAAPTSDGDEDHREIPQEPNWLTGYLGNYPSTFAPLVFNIPPGGVAEVDEPVQQADLLKPLMMDIARYMCIQADQLTDIQVSNFRQHTS